MVLIFSMIYASSVSISATVQNYVYNQKFENSNQNFGAEILEVIVDGQKIEFFPVNYGEYTEYYFYLYGKKLRAATV